MISNLQDLVAPLDESEFLHLLRTRTLRFQRGAGIERYGELIDWNKVREVIESRAYQADRLRITYNRRPMPPAFFTANGRIDAAKLVDLYGRSIGMLADCMNDYVPALGVLCSNISTRLGERVIANANVTIGGGGILTLHYDEYDIVVLQIEGSKRWRIYGPPVTDPVKGMAERTPPQGAPLFDETLQPGDFLFVPAGYWHVCDSGPDRSLHLAVVFRPPAGWHATRALLPELIEEDIFRVPLTRMDSAQRAAHESALKARLIEKIEQMSLSDFIEQSRKTGAGGSASGE